MLWALLYETTARADEILALNVEDLDLRNSRAGVIRKGSAPDIVTWDRGGLAARL
ncbi:tyrosine-type recombinase/integrase [Amycolatopsis coloradensis]|uniref:tyrosine-type recombinase/integrase n=1 Tax=Amycolatopsis coloradensis TaxID=76021 RepID=UPI000A0168B4|nr:tyrosine-type recombinase/integrase [Amycolatopsis coloradensis]